MPFDSKREMVTVGSSRAAVVTGAAVVGLILGLWVQDAVKVRVKARVEQRISDEVARRKAIRDNPPAPGH